MWKEAESGLGDNTKKTLGYGEEADKIESGFVFMGAAAAVDDRSIWQDDGQAKHIVAGDAVFEATRSAGIGGDISSDAAVFEARGIRRVEESLASRLCLKMAGDHSGLDNSHKIPRVDLKD